MRTLIAGGMLLVLAGLASAAVTVDAGTHECTANSVNVIQILISTDALETVAGCTLFVQVGDGTAGTFTAATATLFEGFGAPVNTTNFNGFGYPAISMIDINVDDPANDPLASGVLAALSFDTTGLADGSYALSIGSTQAGGSAIYGSAGALPATFVNGTIIVPEPATLSLLALGGLAMLRRRRKCTGRAGRLMPAIIVVAWLLWLPCGSLWALPMGYTATDLGVGTPMAINNAGQVILQDGGKAYVWDQGVITEMQPLPGHVAATAYGISDDGQVVGMSENVNGSQSYGVLWNTSGQPTELGSLGTGRTYGKDINAVGQVVGYSDAGTNVLQHAFLYHNGNMADLGVPSGFDWSSATSINSAGTVVGRYGWQSMSPSYAFLWKNGVMTTIGPVGTSYTAAVDINDSEQVVGWCDGRAFLWENGESYDLGSSQPWSGRDLAINDDGLIVGNYRAVSGPYSAVIWEDLVPHDLADMVIGHDGLTLVSANDINDSGQIIAESTDYHAWLLTPVPGPATLSLLALGGLAVIRRRRTA